MGKGVSGDRNGRRTTVPVRCEHWSNLEGMVSVHARNGACPKNAARMVLAEEVVNVLDVQSFPLHAAGSVACQ